MTPYRHLCGHHLNYEQAYWNWADVEHSSAVAVVRLITSLASPPSHHSRMRETSCDTSIGQPKMNDRLKKEKKNYKHKKRAHKFKRCVFAFRFVGFFVVVVLILFFNPSLRACYFWSLSQFPCHSGSNELTCSKFPEGCSRTFVLLLLYSRFISDECRPCVCAQNRWRCTSSVVWFSSSSFCFHYPRKPKQLKQIE